MLERHKGITNLQVFNLSSTLTLTPIQTLVLGLGLKYLPLFNPSTSSMIASLTQSITSYIRRLDLRLYFSKHDTTNTNDNTIPSPPSTWNPPRSSYTSHLEDYKNTLINVTTRTIGTSRPHYDLEARIIRSTLIKLRKLPNIIIKPADKILGLVILDTPCYISMCEKHLLDSDTYQLTPSYNHKQLHSRIRGVLNSHHLLFTNNTSRQLTKLSIALLQLEHSPSLRIPPFYCLPKLHKRIEPPYDGRPIISTPSSPTYYASVFLDRTLLPLVKKLPHICLSSRSVVHDMIDVHNPDMTCIFTADVKALYPSIPTTLGIEYTKRSIIELSDFPPPKIDFIIDLLTLVLRNSYCTFNNHTYLQIQGTAMGSPVAVAYANLFLYQIEKPILYLTPYYRRYIDDLFALFETPIIATQFLEVFSNTCPTILLDDNHIDTHGIFLDLTLTLIDGRVTTTLYQKLINKYSYIPLVSNHNPTMFPSFILQEFKRYKLVCTLEQDYTTIARLFTDRLERRGYPTSMIALSRMKVPDRATLTTTLTHNLNPNPTPNPSRPIITLALPKLYPNPKWGTLLAVTPRLRNTLEYKMSYTSPRPVIGTKNPQSTAHIIMSSLYP